MFAVIKTGAKQYKVSPGDRITVEKIDAQAGQSVDFAEVLLPEGGKVSGKVVEQARGDKVLVFKKKRRQHYRRLNGHRQPLTVVEITSVG